ncbi:MAG: 50S ribosomal protein L17 [Candidatus Vogelbacteria bacterium CG10_big_fil_rev_8_21_14_0_10_45_14]|uniref:50S ribosomal protein L17 n=1 Tax=Candidatus Vogelbacteria bacterium CG10_big_fil_rev_8_21_14_0_10_45_14 TaxID=1975042 RepID=A0A2H0RKY4_9BACT|nr:MAG: 50S ribosomal protein L17 [Candidatus Vogelbacteria bacterium CG10_big_fil_rev_8_21_14_0_10_45_14]
MRHHEHNRKFGLKDDERRALLRGLLGELIKHGRMQTTLAKAKEIRPYVEKLLTRAKSGTMADRRILSARLASDSSANKLISEWAPKMKGRTGGYTRITKLAPRASDQAKLAVIEFV